MGLARDTTPNLEHDVLSVVGMGVRDAFKKLAKLKRSFRSSEPSGATAGLLQAIFGGLHPKLLIMSSRAVFKEATSG